MSYTIVLSRRAERDLRHLPGDVVRRVAVARQELSQNPRPTGAAKLSGSDEWRIRIGDYRIRFLIDDEASQITITRIGHRRDIYRK
ncbi:MAG: type II toxin-antitoxin system RelE/ParE family toxin [Planctomycetes bacterium]|nr:type II toxin-antitoxin system RelE/ParE family toxin [Planctomycetota bacterium]